MNALFDRFGALGAELRDAETLPAAALADLTRRIHEAVQQAQPPIYRPRSITDISDLGLMAEAWRPPA